MDAKVLCNICGGITRRSKFSYICQQENGPCGWFGLKKDAGPRQGVPGQASDGQRIYWFRTRQRHNKETPHETWGHHSFLLIHVNPKGVDTFITQNETKIDSRHVVRFI